MLYEGEAKCHTLDMANYALCLFNKGSCKQIVYTICELSTLHKVCEIHVHKLTFVNLESPHSWSTNICSGGYVDDVRCI